MNRLIQFFIILSIAGCTFSKTKDVKSIDIFDKILLVKKSRNLADLETYFGKPKTIELSSGDTAFDDYYFQKTKENPSLNVFVNRKTKSIYSLSLNYGFKFDAYAYLKKRFKDYKWIETELPLRTDLDYAEEIHRVEIPELGITFEYDNQDPLRRPQSIFFK
jgi:hypothetical protein